MHFVETSPKISKITQGPAGSNGGPWLVLHLMKVCTCVPRVPWYAYCCLECKIIAYMDDFLLRPFGLPTLKGFPYPHHRRVKTLSQFLITGVFFLSELCKDDQQKPYNTNIQGIQGQPVR